MTNETVRVADLVGVAEIAERVHLSKQAVSGWYRNGLSHMPEPMLVLKMGALWEWPVIVRWLTRPGAVTTSPSRVSGSPPRNASTTGRCAPPNSFTK